MSSRFNRIKQSLGKPIEKGLDYLGRPNAAMKSGVMDYVKNDSLSGALGSAASQLGMPSDSAPSGYDVAEAIGSKYDIQSPAALTALSVGAEMMDVPGVGMAGKGLRMANKASKPTQNVAEGIRVLDDTPNAQRLANKNYGSVRTPDMMKKEDIGRTLDLSNMNREERIKALNNFLSNKPK